MIKQEPPQKRCRGADERVAKCCCVEGVVGGDEVEERSFERAGDDIIRRLCGTPYTRKLKNDPGDDVDARARAIN